MSKSKSQALSLKKVLQKTKTSRNSGAPSPFILGMKDASWSHTQQAEVKTAPKEGGRYQQTDLLEVVFKLNKTESLPAPD